jgi:hypothetical protein
MELVDIIKDYVFHTIKKIPKNDERYPLLRSIEPKEYDPADGVTYVYLTITLEKTSSLLTITSNIKYKLLDMTIIECIQLMDIASYSSSGPNGDQRIRRTFAFESSRRFYTIEDLRETKIL